MSPEALERAESIASYGLELPDVSADEAHTALRSTLDHAAAQALRMADLAYRLGKSEAALTKMAHETRVARAQVKILGEALTRIVGATVAAQNAMGELATLAAQIADTAETDMINVVV